MKKYQLWWDFVKTETEAKKLCVANDNRMTRYMRQKHPSHYTPYEWSDTKETGFMVWCYR